MPGLVFLIGMPAAGKTYWGVQLAAALGLQFIDLDKYIVHHEQKSIPGLFEDSGEHVFRGKETQYLIKVISTTTESTIIACGGGTPCFNNNLALMKNAGTVVYLQTNIPWLLANLEEDNEPRPLLDGKKDLPDFLHQLLEQRKGCYEQAHIILPTDNISLPTFVEMISSCINKP